VKATHLTDKSTGDEAQNCAKVHGAKAGFDDINSGSLSVLVGVRDMVLIRLTPSSPTSLLREDRGTWKVDWGFETKGESLLSGSPPKERADTHDDAPGQKFSRPRRRLVS